jgi:hypothetical protein
MPFPNGLKNLAPEADLRNVVVRRREKPIPTEEANRSAPQSERAAGLFFDKGHATAHSFRPSYWNYGDRDDTAADETGTVVDLRIAAANHETKTGGTEDSELLALERAFFESQLKLLTQPPELQYDRDGASVPETSQLATVDPEGRAPEADLRTVLLRPTAIAATEDDGLFLRKILAAEAKDEPSSSASERPDTTDKSRDVVAAKPSTDGWAGREPVAAAGDLEEVRANPGLYPAPVAPGRGKSKAKSRRSAKASAGIGVLAAGFVALVVSLWVLFDVNSPQTRVDVAVSLPKILAPVGTPIVAPPAAPAAAPVAPPVVAPLPPPVVAPTLPPVVALTAPPRSSAVDSYLAQGNENLRHGDVFAARLFFKRAADAGDAHGALMMGVTYDPTFLGSIGVRGLLGDEAAALSWYRRAAQLGAPEAAELMENLRHK